MIFLTPETMEEELKRINLWKEGNKFFVAQIFLDGTAETMRNVVINKTDDEIYMIPCDYSTNELLPEQGIFIKNEHITDVKISKGNFGFNNISLFKGDEKLISFQISKAIRGKALENIKSVINCYPNGGTELLDKSSLWKNRFVGGLALLLFTAFFLIIGVLMILDEEYNGIFLLGLGVIFVYSLIMFVKKSVEESIEEKEAKKDNPIK